MKADSFTKRSDKQNGPAPVLSEKDKTSSPGYDPLPEIPRKTACLELFLDLMKKAIYFKLGELGGCALQPWGTIWIPDSVIMLG